MWWRVGRRRTSLGAALRQLRKISAEASRCGGGDWAGGGLQYMLKDTTDIAIVAVIAWREVQEAGVMKGWEEGDLSKNKSVQLVSQACRTVLGEFDGKLDRLSSFLKLCQLGSILVEVENTQLKCELEILDINTFT